MCNKTLELKNEGLFPSTLPGQDGLRYQYIIYLCTHSEGPGLVSFTTPLMRIRDIINVSSFWTHQAYKEESVGLKEG